MLSGRRDSIKGVAFVAAILAASACAAAERPPIHYVDMEPKEVIETKTSPLPDKAASLLPADGRWNLVWHDEFDGREVDKTKWMCRESFWGEDFPAFAHDFKGVEMTGETMRLHLVREGDDFCSPHLQTGSLSYDIPKDTKGFWPFGKRRTPLFMKKYGYFEIRCRLPKHRGWHAAFWLQSPSIGAHPDHGVSGIETDIMENHSLYTEGRMVCGNLYGGYGRDYVPFDHFHWTLPPSGDGDWHVFGCEWSPDGYDFYCDGRKVGEQNWAVSHVEQFVLVSTEPSGYRMKRARRQEGGVNAEGMKESQWGLPNPLLFKVPLPDFFEVDYVRVYDRERPLEALPELPVESVALPEGAAGDEMVMDARRRIGELCTMSVESCRRAAPDAEMLRLNSVVSAGLDRLERAYKPGDNVQEKKIAHVKSSKISCAKIMRARGFAGSKCVSAALCGDVVEDALSRRLSAYDHFGMGEHMQELLVNRVAEMDHAADEAWFALKTPDEIAAYRARLRDRMIAAVGGFPERTPLNPQYFDAYKHDGYTIEGVVFESRPKHYVTGQFFIPADPAFKPPYPGVLITCGHTKAGKDSPCYQRAAVVAAKHGFATLIFDPIDQGERQQLPGTDIWSVGGHVNAGLRAHLIGWGTAQFRLWDGIRALDLLASRPEVNPEKVAVTGMSGGGTMSSYLNAVDWRFSAASPAGFLTSIMYLGDKCGPQDCEQVIHGQLAFGLNHLSLMLMNGGSALCPGFTWGDAFPYLGSMETIRKAQEFRRREGRPELIDYFDCPGPHHWYESEKEALCAWFRRHLVGDTSAWPVDRAALRRLDVGFDYANVDCALAGKPECEVLSGRGVMSLPGARSVYDLIADELMRLEKSRVPPTPDVVANAAGIKLADASAAKACASSSVEKDGVKVCTAVLDMPDMARVPVTAFIPANAGGTPVLVVGDATKRVAYAGKVREMLAAGRPVAVAELRGFGETGATDRRSYWARRSPDQEIAAKFSWLGENLVAHRAEDLLAAAEWFADLVGGAKCELRAEGRAVVPAAHAYFLARGRFISFASERAPQSWTAMVRDPSIGISFAEVVYGALKSYDWTDLVK